MSSSHLESIAIIGAGLGGVALALSLHQHLYHESSDRPLKITLYEQSQSAALVSPGAVMLSPNALSVLDRLGVYAHLRPQGFEFESSEFRDSVDSTKVTGRQWFGSQSIYGYKALRIYRPVLVQALLDAAHSKPGIEILFNKRYGSIVSETAEMLTFKFADGDTATASLLIGADGIHSKVRSYIAPNIEPEYQGFVAVVGVTPLSALASTLPNPGDKIPGPLVFPSRGGSFILAPQDVQGTELMAGTQRPHPAQDRAAWNRFAHDKEALHQFLHADIEGWPPMVQAAIHGIDMDTVYIWAQFTVPRLESWLSARGRALLVADAAHAIPPTMGQGANQAFEDGYSLALLLAKTAGKEVGLDPVLKFWQGMRQERVDRLIDLTVKMNNARLPKEMQDKLPADRIWRDESGGKGDAGVMRWLFQPGWEGEIDNWVGGLE